MNTKGKIRRSLTSGLTLIEVLIVIAVIVLASIVLMLPAFLSGDQHRYAIRTHCASNLKEIALAFRIWEGDNDDHYPMSYYTNASGPLYMDSSNVFRYYMTMSNELSNPQILLCPDDKTRRAATNFTTDFNGSHISYFVGLDSDETTPQEFLAGDSNLKTDAPIKNGLLLLTTNQSISWTKERHNGNGNVALADGSVQQFSSAGLQAALTHTGVAKNRLLMPP